MSFGRIEGLGATNVIPNNVTIQGTFRTMDEKWRAKAHELIKKQSELLVQSFGGTLDIEIRKGYPYLENDLALTARTKVNTSDFFGESNVIDLPIRLTGEDFAYYGQKIPATFIRIGVANDAKGINFPVHNAKFDIDNSALTVGIQTLLTICFY